MDGDNNTATPTAPGLTAEVVQQMINQAIATDRAQRQGERSAAVVREGLSASLAATREQRKKTLIDSYKLTPAEAEMEITESDARALRNVEPAPAVVGGGSFFGRSPIKPEDLTEFHGDPLKLNSWLLHVEGLHDHRLSREWQDPIITLIPLCLKGAASRWYDLLSLEEGLRLTSWHEWKTQLSSAFKPDLTDLRRAADNRKWVVRKELIQAYYYDKVALLKEAYPHRQDPDFILDIKIGLPAGMQISVRTNMMINPTLSAMLTELLCW